MRLYHVQDSDRPMYVVADDFEDAARRWRARMAVENGDEPDDEHGPDGITLLGTCGGDFPDVLLLDAEMLTMAVVTGLFTNWNGTRASRLVLMSEDGVDLGGWSFGPARDRMLDVLRGAWSAP